MGGEEGKEKTRLEALEEVVGELIDKVEAQAKELDTLKRTAVKKSSGLFGGKREKTAIKDTKTGTVYPSKASVGKALADEADTSPADHFAWYKLQAKFPERFVEATAEEAKKVWDEEKAKIEKEVAEANAKLEAERKAAEAKGAKK